MKPARLLLLAVFAAPLFVGLDDSSVWDANEAFYVQTPREMLQSGDWIVPRFNGRPRLNKPPLSYWVVAAFYGVFGVDLFWERLAMALAAAGSLGAAYRLGRTLYDPTVGLLAVGMLASTFRFLILSRRLLIDVLLLLCLLAAAACFVDWLRGGRSRAFLWGTVWMALGLLAKGPLALFPGLLLAAHLAATRRLDRLRRAPWAWALLLMLTICAPWFVLLGLRAGWEAPLDFFLRENLGRFAALDYGPRRGIFYYFGVFAADFFPWSLFFAAAVVWRILEKRRGGDDDRERDWLLWIWMGVWFVGFSLSRNKQEYYIVPLYPAAAIWTAAQLRRLPSKVPAALAAPVLAAVAVGLYWVGGSLFPETALLWLPPLFLVLFPAAALGRRWPAAAASLSLFFASGFAIYLGPLEAYRPIRHLAETVMRLERSQGKPARAGYYRFTAPSLAFYLNRPIREIYELEEAASFLESPQSAFLILAESDLAGLREAARAPLEVVERRPALSTNAKTLLAALRSGRPLHPGEWTRPVLLVTNRPRPEGSAPRGFSRSAK